MRSAAVNKKWVVFAVGLGLFMAMLDATIVNISIPTMMKDFHTTYGNIAWVLDAYMLTLAVLVLVMGRLADQFGRRLLYGIGICIFTVGSLLCAVSSGVGWLIGFRCLQAVGSAVMIPATMAIMTAAFPPEKRGAAMGLWSAIGITAAAIGPTLGGVFVQYLSWHWIFYINIPIGILALALTWFKLPEYRDENAPRQVDYVGVITSSISVFTLVLAIIKGGDWGWTSSTIITLFVLSAEFLAAFLIFEKLQSKPMVELRIFKSVTFSSSVVGQMLVAFGMLGAMFLLTMFLQNVLGYSALRAAVAITPVPAAALITGPLAGKLIDKIGSRILTVVGVIALALGLFLFSQLGAGAGWGDVAWRAVIVGAGMGLSNVGLAVAAMGATSAGKEGVGAGVLNMSRMIGMALGVAVSVALLSSYAPAHMTDAQNEITSVIMADQQIPPAMKGQIGEQLAAMSNVKGPQQMPDLAAIATKMGAPASMLPHLQELSGQIAGIIRKDVSRAYDDVYKTIAIICSIGILPSLLLGRPRKQAKGESAMANIDMG